MFCVILGNVYIQSQGNIFYFWPRKTSQPPGNLYEREANEIMFSYVAPCKSYLPTYFLEANTLVMCLRLYEAELYYEEIEI